MPTNITPAATFDTVIPAPNDGEAVDRASLVQFAQPILNRTEALKSTLTTVFGVRDLAASTVVGPLTIVTSPGVSVVSGTLANSLAGDIVTIDASIYTEHTAGPSGFDRITLRAAVNGVSVPVSNRPIFWLDTNLGAQQMVSWKFQVVAPVNATPYQLFVERQAAGGTVVVQLASVRVTAERLYSF